MESFNSVGTYLREINKIPLLTVEGERELAERILQGDSEAQKKLIEANLRFVVFVAKKYQGRGISLEDLIGSGNEGLTEAAKRYNLKKNTRFTTYAGWWVRQSILKTIAYNSNTIRVPYPRQADLLKINRVRKEFYEREGYYPSTREISKQTTISQQVIKDLFEVSEQPISLEKPLSYNEDILVGDSVEDTRVDVEGEVFKNILRQDIERVFSENGLSKRNKELIQYKYGLKDGSFHSREETAEKCGITKERVRQIEEAVFSKIRDPKTFQRLRAYID